jgi:hypothetical protein
MIENQKPWQRQQICCKAGCTALAHAIPVLIFKAGDKELRARPQIYLCEKHCTEMTVENFLTDDAWNVISAPAVKSGMAPDRASAKLVFEKLP